MARQPIDIGSAINAGDGEPIRNAFAKINEMMAEIYGWLAVDGLDPNFLAANSILNAKLATMPANTVKANLTASPASPSNVSLTALSAAMHGTLIGEVKEYSGPFLPPFYRWADGAAYLRADLPDLFAETTAAMTGNTSNGSTTVTSVSRNLVGLGLEGAPIEGAGIPAGAIIASVTSSTIVLSVAATAPGTAVALRAFPHGNGDGATTFNVVDRRGRAGFGRDNMGGTAASRVTSAISGVNAARLGASGGDQRMHQHNHGVTDPGHYHGAKFWGWNNPFNILIGGTPANAYFGQYSNTDLAYTGITIQNFGAGSSQNMPPASVCNFIVFAGA